MKRGPRRWRIYDGSLLSVCSPTWERALAWVDYVRRAAA